MVRIHAVCDGSCGVVCGLWRGEGAARPACAWFEDVLVGGSRICLLKYSFDVYTARQQTLRLHVGF